MTQANENPTQDLISANDNLTPEGVEKAAQAAVFAVANLIGRRMAREYFASYRAANDNCSSTDKQSASSIEDQFRLCEEHAMREKWAVVGSYHDAAISGSGMALRPGIQALLRDAQAGAFDVVLAEALDRISRDQADVATLFKRLSFEGIVIITLAEGEINELHVGLKGTMNALYIKTIARNTHRGLLGRVMKGKSGGGLCYGYRALKKVDANFEPVRGDREIITEESEVVCRIFRAFAAGQSPRSIAVELNGEGVPGPKGRAWSDTTIRGHVSRGTGVVNNELYAGVIVWNRQRFIKDPITEKRVSRPNPEHLWIRTEVPELRIVPDDLWQAVRARQKEIAAKVGPCPANTRDGVDGLPAASMCHDGGSLTIRRRPPV